MRFLDVGQGDAILLSSDGKSALIDTGGHDDIVRHLQSLGVGTLELLLISHNYADHIGGADAVLTSLGVRAYLDNELPSKTKIQQTVLRLLDVHKIEIVPARARTIALGLASLRILPPPLHDPHVDQNDASVGVIAECGRFKALLTGDSEAAEQGAWLAAGVIPQVTVLKAAHHGSRNGVTPAWIEQTRPEVVVMSVGAGNDYGHPHAEALRLYMAAGRKVLRTDWYGDITFNVASDGAYAITTTREPPPLQAAPPTTSSAQPPVASPPQPLLPSPLVAASPLPPAAASPLPPSPPPAPGTTP